MSADDTEISMLRGLESGAAVYIVKPVKYNDLKNIWQYASENDKSVDKHQNVGAALEEEPPVEVTSNNPIDLESGSFVHGVNHKTRREPKKKASSKRIIIEESGNNNNDVASLKRTKFVWTSALHNQFLEVVRKIGLESKSTLIDLSMFFQLGLT